MSAIADNLININLLEIIELKSEINEKVFKKLTISKHIFNRIFH